MSSRKIFLIGTKSDLLGEDELKKFREEIELKYINNPELTYYATSSKMNLGIDKIFTQGLYKCIESNKTLMAMTNNKPMLDLQKCTNVEQNWLGAWACNIL